ncbi:MAG: LysR substrate-binding domain-containing protein [Hyphomicrobiales bacterium]|nr:LysR substrate-binding domain-containing protein [Hyphomicrobiales bacterium]
MNYASLTLRDLEYLVAVADLSGVSAAAAQCRVAQPSLSAQVKKIETNLEVVIFERGKGRMTLTPKGAPVVAQARVVLAEARRLFEVARTGGDPLSGTLRLGVIATLAPYLIPHLIDPVQTRFPCLKLIFNEALTAELIAALVAGELDAALLSTPLSENRLRAEPLFFEPFFAICHAQSQLSEKTGLSLADLEEEGMILMDEGHCLRGQALEACRVRAGGRQERHAASVETLRHLVAAGSGHSLIPALAVKYDPRLDRTVRYFPLVDQNVGRTIALTWRASDPRSCGYQVLSGFLASISLPGVVRLAVS